MLTYNTQLYRKHLAFLRRTLPEEPGEVHREAAERVCQAIGLVEASDNAICR